MTIKDWFLGPVSPIQTVQFADGTSASLSALLNAMSNVTSQASGGYVGGVGTNELLTADGGNDTMQGGLGNDTFVGGAGSDTMNGGGGTNTFTGGTGRDTMNGAGTADTFTGGTGSDTMNGGHGTNTFTGGSGADVMNGGGAGSVNTFTGGAGADTMDSNGGAATYIGGSGADTMGNSWFYSAATQSSTTNAAGLQVGDTYVAGTGGDVMYGTNSSNTYELALGDGSDTIISAGASADITWGYQNGANGNVDNVLKFGAGITAASLTAKAVGADLILGYSATDSVTIKDWFLGPVSPIQTVQFADGTSASLSTLLNAMSSVSTQVSGGHAWGVGANEVLTADGGNDTLQGGLGNDTFVIGANALTDVVQVAQSPGTNTSTVDFTSANSNQLWFQKNGNDLDISVIGTSTVVDIAGWYTGASSGVQEIKAADGKVLLESQVASLVNAMASLSPPGAGVTTLPTTYQTQLNPVIAAAWH